MRKDGRVDLSKVTLRVGDQKGGSQALLKAAGRARPGCRTRSSWKRSPPGPRCSRRSTPARSTSAASATPRRCSPPPPKSKITVVAGAHDAAARATRSSSRRAPRITSVADLKGKKVARRRGQLGQLQPARAARTRPGLSYDDITVQNLQPADALAAFTGGHVDAWAIWDPYTSQAEVQTGARVARRRHRHGQRR